jgi:hypothetical protein
VVGQDGVIFITMNGGTTWDEEVSGTTNTIHGVCISPANKGYAIGDIGTILGTYDGGVGITAKPPREELKVYPNPARDKITLELMGNHGECSLSVLNSLGNEVLNDRFFKNNKTINIFDLPKGFYFLRLQSSTTVTVGKIIKE